MLFHGLNVVSCEIVTGHTRTPLVDTYLPPSTLEHFPDAKESLQRFKGLYPIVLGDLNVDLDNARRSRSQRVADLLMDFSTIDLVRRFRQRWRFQYLKTWTQVIQGVVLRLRCGYILGTDWR